MHIEYTASLTLVDVCESCDLQPADVLEIVGHGIITPAGDSSSEWIFDLQMISLLKRAQRLQQDLHLDWSAVALVLELLDEREQLRAENARLQQRLARFLSD